MYCKVEKGRAIDANCGLSYLFGFLGKELLLAVCAEILVQLCVDPAVVCAGWEGNCKGNE